MRILRIEATPFAIPYQREVAFATGTLRAAEHILLRVVTEEGVTGVAEVVPRPMVYGETVASVLGALETVVRPLLCGQDVGPGYDLQQRLRNLVANNTLRGALDLALWDAAGRRAGLPCWAMMGGDGAPDGVEVTAMLGLGTPESVVDEAVALAERHGFRSFKLKVGLDVRKDVEVCAAMRAAFSDALVYVDANHGLAPGDAIWFAERVRDLDLAWIEEPADARAVVGRDRVARSLSQLQLADESAPDACSAARELLAGRADLVSVKVARTGLTESHQILALCDALGGGVVIGTQGDSELGTAAGLQFAALSESARRRPAELTYFATVLAGGVLASPLAIEDGRMRVPAGPGLGVELDEEEIARHAV